MSIVISPQTLNYNYEWVKLWEIHQIIESSKVLAEKWHNLAEGIIKCVEEVSKCFKELFETFREMSEPAYSIKYNYYNNSKFNNIQVNVRGYPTIRIPNCRSNC